jgi:hypothetical protein
MQEKAAMEDVWIPGGVRLIKMMVELHRRGLQLLRIFPYEYPLAWRLRIAPKSLFSSRNGAYIDPSHFGDRDIEDATHSSSSGLKYFGLENVERLDAEHLASEFVRAFPRLCEAGQGPDWEYAGWLSELSGYLSQTNVLPFVMAEYFETDPNDLTYLPLRDYARGNEVTKFPLPPSSRETDRRGLREERDELRIRVGELESRIGAARDLLNRK